MGKLEYDPQSEWSHHSQNRKVGKVGGEIPVIQSSRDKDYCSAAGDEQR